ncbi:hypothetical protein [Paraburkholderia sp. BL6669N2]|uniref:hypothetical protein n=1 Tax=Paraburkholderia sp. BL6669N2 TaxID=1938807 RepID=UPI001C6E2105|nr:hypothetical protein [Paraburkholderia sp. BL6669N2]
MAKPFYCIHCDEPLSGAPLSFGDYLDSPSNEMLLRERFASLNLWADKATVRLNPLRNFLSSHQCRALWDDAEQLARAAGHVLNPLPRNCTLPGREIDILAWDLQMRATRSVEHRGSALREPNSMRTAQSVYRVVLRRIEMGLAGAEKHADISSLVVDIRRTGKMVLRGITPQFAAYAWFRHRNELMGAYDDVLPAALAERSLDTRYFLRVQSDDRSRLAIYSGLMAVYGAMHAVVLRHVIHGYMDVSVLADGIEGTVPAFLPGARVQRNRSREVGLVFFPMILGRTAAPFKPSPRRIDQVLAA